MWIHLDPVGGLAGDMFVAAILDAWPELDGDLREALRSVRLGENVAVEVLPHKDHTLTGTRFCVAGPGAEAGRAHTPFSEIRRLLDDSELAPAVRDRAIDIFTLLARAEAEVHGRPLEEVTFHEVGAWDSIADIVGASLLIEALGARGWSTSSLRSRALTARCRCPHPLRPCCSRASPFTTTAWRGSASRPPAQRSCVTSSRATGLRDTR
jgi:uncharacterized protein (DUF111 family)